MTRRHNSSGGGWDPTLREGSVGQRFRYLFLTAPPSAGNAARSDLAALRAELGDESFAAAWAEGRAATAEQAVDDALNG